MEYRTARMVAVAVSLLALAGCPGGEKPKDAPAPTPVTPAVTTPTPKPNAAAALGADLPKGLLISYAQFEVKDGEVTAKPGPAHLELMRREGGEWKTTVIEDKESNVFHKAIAYVDGAVSGILTFAGTDAIVKFWTRGSDGAYAAKTLWKENFGGTFNRMREAEVGDVYGDGKATLAIATHDHGIVATMRPEGEGKFKLDKLDTEANTFIHEIELGDVNKDGAMEIYATPSEPNKLEGGAQHGEVVRYVPSKGEGRTVVADLGNRHAKEIYVGDVDGDGTDELYVAVEALTSGEGGATIEQPVEIRRYDKDTPKDGGAVIAKLNDRFCRFLTVGDVDGDGKKEMIAAAFRTGVWLLRPGKDPKGEWSVESVDRDSSGFEHAALLTDLDGDKIDELYVGADEQGELRRYVWVNGKAKREVIAKRELPRAMMTWNIMPAPAAMLK
jgi:hypothetical protein